MCQLGNVARNLMAAINPVRTWVTLLELCVIRLLIVVPSPVKGTLQAVVIRLRMAMAMLATTVIAQGFV
jgi:hypothetical protein